jgi:lipopolysaccharide/colanic/teichoic acid biosynthesis glycosyltransferase
VRSGTVNGDLRIDEFIPQARPAYVGGELRKLFGRMVISPLFLVSSLLVLYFVPDGLLKRSKRSRTMAKLCDLLDRSMDIGVSLSLLVLLSPLLLLVGVVVKLESGGPVFYRQTRVGKNYRNGGRKIWLNLREQPSLEERRNGNLCGKPFNLYKFRTMVADAEVSSGPVWARKDDPRVTRVGKFLRSTYLDEIPQLFNVFRGHMSLVGPRPERPYFTRRLAVQVPQYPARFSVKPGITGLAQVKRRSDSSVEDVKKKLRFDRLYCQKKCLLLKIRIIALTARLALNGVARGQTT